MPPLMQEEVERTGMPLPDKPEHSKKAALKLPLETEQSDGRLLNIFWKNTRYLLSGLLSNVW